MFQNVRHGGLTNIKIQIGFRVGLIVAKYTMTNDSGDNTISSYDYVENFHYTIDNIVSQLESDLNVDITKNIKSNDLIQGDYDPENTDYIHTLTFDKQITLSGSSRFDIFDERFYNGTPTNTLYFKNIYIPNNVVISTSEADITVPKGIYFIQDLLKLLNDSLITQVILDGSSNPDILEFNKEVTVVPTNNFLTKATNTSLQINNSYLNPEPET